MPATTAEPRVPTSLHLFRIQPIYTPKEISCLIKNLLARDFDRTKILRDSSSILSRAAATADQRTLITKPTPNNRNRSQ